MQLAVEHKDDVAIVRVREARLTYPLLGPFVTEVRALIEGGGRKVLLDLAGVTYVDSATIGCFMDVYRLLRERAGTLRLCALTPRVETMISMTGMHRIVDVHADEAAALIAFATPEGGRA